MELQAKANGRDHNHWGYTTWLAGGAVKAGYVHGATDDFGFKAVDKPVHVHDLQATILYTLGFDHEKLTYRFQGRVFASPTCTAASCKTSWRENSFFVAPP